MGFFSNLMDKVFSRDGDPDAGGASAASSAETPGVDLRADTVPLDADTHTVAAQAPAPESMPLVDVEAKLDALEKMHPEDLDWKKSIVDLCKLLDIDSSYGARKEMALELGYTHEKIDAEGSAEMNMWLHKEVMRKIAENGGKLPDGLHD